MRVGGAGRGGPTRFFFVVRWL